MIKHYESIEDMWERVKHNRYLVRHTQESLRGQLVHVRKPSKRDLIIKKLEYIQMMEILEDA